MTRYFLYIFVSNLLLFGLNSCGSKSKKEGKPVDTVVDAGIADSNLLKTGVLEKLDYAIINLRSSDVFIQILSKQTNLYDNAILNNVKNVHEYESSKAKALNLGVYGADLNYVIHFNQTPVSLKYLLCAKQLSDQIGVSMAFDKKALDKFNGNVNQKDTLINIVSSAYDVIKKYLRNDDQFQVASLVMIGSWVENMYLTLGLVDKCANVQDEQIILNGILNQKEYLKNLISLFSILENQNDNQQQTLVGSLKEIDGVLEKISTVPPDKQLIAKLKDKVVALRVTVVDAK